MVYLYSLIALLMLNVCFALYEDQVGLFDWRQKYIGNAKEVYFGQLSHSSKRAFVTTEDNVLAALNARTGQLVWRQVFEKKHGKIGTLLHSSNFLITVSGEGKMVRSWDPNRGHLIWETSSSKNSATLTESKYLNLPNILKGHHAFMLEDDNGGLVVTTNRAIRMISINDGSEVWEYVVSEDNVYVFGATKVDNHIIAFCSKEKNNLSFLNFKHIDIESGKLSDDVVIQSNWILQPDTSCELVSSKYFTCINQEASAIFIKNYKDNSHSAFYSTYLSLLNISSTETLKPSSIIALSKDSNNDEFCIRVNQNHNILAKINTELQRPEVVKELFSPGIYRSINLSKNKYFVEIFKDLDTKNLHVNVFKSDDMKTPIKNLETRIIYDEKTNPGIPIHSVVYMYAKKNDVSYRILLISEEYSISLIQNVGSKDGKILWTRNEALSRVSNIKMIDLPPSTSASKLELLHAEFSVLPNSGIFNMFVNRVKSQIRQLQAFTESLKKRQRFSNTNIQEGERTALPKRDQFSIIKVILLLTNGRKLFAINSQNGEIVWSRFLPDIKLHTSIAAYVIEQRTTAHFPLPAQCLLIAPYNKNILVKEKFLTSTKEHTAVYTFNPLTGAGLEKPSIIETYKILQVAELPFEDEKSLKVVAIIDTDHYFHVIPETKDTFEKLHHHLNSIYIYIVNKTTNSFQGYKVRKVQSKFKLYEVWSVHIPANQKIVNMKSKSTDEVINSVGRVLGDHTVLYKYLNPNLLGFTTIQGGSLKGSIFVYIVDAVTGHVVYQARHKGAEQPLDLILSENWLIYTYYNTKGKRTEISTVEFYEGYIENNHTAFSSLDPIGLPMVLSQGYTLPVCGVTTMTATRTKHGITNKNILIGLENGYVYSLPKIFLDPRRNFKQTPMLQEEGVPPYMPELPLAPQGYINYNQTVSNIRGIYTSAAGLESTSLVLVYGLDLFYTRVTPSKMFDVLKEDFDYIFISGVLSALILTSIICSKFASMRALKLAWQ